MKNLLKLMALMAFCLSFFTAEACTYTVKSKDFFTTIHILVVDPSKNKIIAVKSDKDKQRETVLSLAQKHQAIGAINGGFWKQNGAPAGILKIDNTWYGKASRPRGAIGWSHYGKHVVIDRLISQNEHSEKENCLQAIPMLNPCYTEKQMWENADNIIGGAPLLIANGELITDYSPEQTVPSFLSKKRARTAVGIKDSGEWVFVVVDTRFYGFFGGISIKDLAKLLKDLQCTKALNLDGGSSSTMVVNGQIVNNSYGYIREGKKLVQAVSDAILILP